MILLLIPILADGLYDSNIYQLIVVIAAKFYLRYIFIINENNHLTCYHWDCLRHSDHYELWELSISCDRQLMLQCHWSWSR